MLPYTTNTCSDMIFQIYKLINPISNTKTHSVCVCVCIHFFNFFFKFFKFQCVDTISPFRHLCENIWTISNCSISQECLVSILSWSYHKLTSWVLFLLWKSKVFLQGLLQMLCTYMCCKENVIAYRYSANNKKVPNGFRKCISTWIPLISLKEV